MLRRLDTDNGFTGSATGVIMGGTGRFAGAPGSFEMGFTGSIQVSDPNANPPQEFGSFTGKGTGIIIIP